MLKELYPWESVEKSLEYNRAFFGFLIVRTILANIPFDLTFIMLYGPAHLWDFILKQFVVYGWCSSDIGDYNI